MTIGSIISLIIAAVSAIIATWTIINLYVRMRRSKNVMITKSNGETIIMSKSYNREDSRRFLEFIK